MCTMYDSYNTNEAYHQKYIHYVIEGVVYNSGAGLPNTTDWVRMQSTFLSDKVIFWDEVLGTYEYAKSVTWTNVYVGILADTDASTRYGYIDWLAVRKYADPEPTVEYITPIKVPLFWFNRWISLLSPYAVYRLYASLYHDTHRLTDVLHNDIIASSTTSHDRTMETVQITSDKHESISLTSSTNAVFGPNYTSQELTIARFIASTTNTLTILHKALQQFYVTSMITQKDYIQQQLSQMPVSFIMDNITPQSIIDAQYRKYEMILKHAINKDQILKYISDNIIIKQIQSMFESEHSILYVDTAIEGASLTSAHIGKVLPSIADILYQYYVQNINLDNSISQTQYQQLNLVNRAVNAILKYNELSLINQMLYTADITSALISSIENTYIQAIYNKIGHAYMIDSNIEYIIHKTLVNLHTESIINQQKVESLYDTIMLSGNRTQYQASILQQIYQQYGTNTQIIFQILQVLFQQVHGSVASTYKLFNQYTQQVQSAHIHKVINPYQYRIYQYLKQDIPLIEINFLQRIWQYGHGILGGSGYDWFFAMEVKIPEIKSILLHTKVVPIFKLHTKVVPIPLLRTNILGPLSN